MLRERLVIGSLKDVRVDMWHRGVGPCAEQLRGTKFSL